MVAAVLSVICAYAPPGEGPFEAAAIAPPDTRILMRVRGAADMRQDAALAGAHTALARFAGDRVLTTAWGSLAGALGQDGGALFDAVLGTDAIYLERAGADSTEWAVVTRTTQETYDQLVAHLKPSMQGNGRVLFAAQGLKAAWRPPHLVVGPVNPPGLVDHIMAAVDAPSAAGAPAPPSLADDPEVALAAAWPAARVEFILRTGGAHAGTTVAAATAADGTIAVRHRSRFARPPIHIAPGAPPDLGLIAPFAGDSLAVFAMNPWRGALDPAEPVDALLLEGRLDDPMRANMGARQLFVVGERAVSGTGMRAPSLGLAFEVRDAVLAERQWDGWALRFMEHMAARAQQEAPAFPPTTPGQVRQANMGALFARVLADHPFARGMDLCWVTLATPDGAWQVLSTDRALLDAITSRLGGVVRAPAPGEWHEAGWVRGTAIADHLKTWVGEARAFLPEAPDAFAAGVTLAAEVAGMADSIDWRARAPEPAVIESEMVLRVRQVAAAPAPPQPPPASPPAPPPASPDAAPAPPPTPPAAPPEDGQ